MITLGDACTHWSNSSTDIQRAVKGPPNYETRYRDIPCRCRSVDVGARGCAGRSREEALNEGPASPIRRYSESWRTGGCISLILNSLRVLCCYMVCSLLFKSRG